MDISVPFHLFRLMCFGVGFLYAGSLWFLFTVEVPPVGQPGQVACQGFMVKEACINVLLGGTGSLLSGVQ